MFCVAVDDGHGMKTAGKRTPLFLSLIHIYCLRQDQRRRHPQNGSGSLRNGYPWDSYKY